MYNKNKKVDLALILEALCREFLPEPITEPT